MDFGVVKRLSVALFGNIVEENMEHFIPLKPQLEGAGIQILLKTWISLIMLISVFAYVLALAISIAVSTIFALDMIVFIYIVVMMPVFVAAITFFGFYIYPVQKSNSIRSEIENNLPFALAHMSAIVSSGIPPENMFDMLTDFSEYGSISNHARMIVRNVSTFGMSSSRAINIVAKKCPSPSFRQVLMGISTTIEKGGNLPDYIKKMSDKALFEYRIKREKYLKTLSTYADIYTALLVAAPLMMLAVLGIMGIIGGEVLGLSINDLVTLITYIILPSLNIAFLAFIHLTYPGI